MGSSEFRERMLQIAPEYDGLAEWVKREIAGASPVLIPGVNSPVLPLFGLRRLTPQPIRMWNDTPNNLPGVAAAFGVHRESNDEH